MTRVMGIGEWKQPKSRNVCVGEQSRKKADLSCLVQNNKMSCSLSQIA